ncbi:MAG: dienelactone hydrolase family protein [Thermomonas sp.]
MLETVEHDTGPQPRWSVLWLHGLGADGNDFAPIVPELLVRDGVSRDWPALRFVFPHAPVRAVTINGGARMRAWYDIRDFNLSNRADLEGVAESVAQVEALITRESERGVPADRVLLVGFSQGGAIALAAGIARKTPLAGLAGLSTYLPMPPAQAAAVLQANAAAQPLFMAHGQSDPVVPYAGGELSARAMAEMGFDVQWHRYPMQHAVCAEEIRDLGDWMSARFAAD